MRRIASIILLAFVFIIIYGSAILQVMMNFDLEVTPSILLFSMIFNMFLVGFSSIIISYLWHGSFSDAVEKLGFTWRDNGKAILYGVIASLSFIFIFSSILWLAGYGGENPLEKKIASSINIYLLILLPVFASVSEEIFFRGLIQLNLEEKIHPALAIIVASSLFSFAHIEYGVIIEVVGTFIFSILLGIIVHFTRNILSSITSHFLYDFIVLASLYYSMQI